ncbi:ferrous iron transport protein B [Candidatus Bathyarchaeota archaeon]|nr:ferrous iron transport protein B [Candidatus Bathyarchaeota archaeon]NIR16979.1 ferrous iron transport protein B [Desulfobacterales bacterium]NIU80824.1 ferrous iron transport protein B [Candidatus Bathyarchaeota archaeon]NIV67459.1 ferrous iron transport protein B [Candidatus Bathyarchaeota archaeon]NIW16006.1 ferrous iron transport protein B [Candidatus Bathyarchaeota archaeon]
MFHNLTGSYVTVSNYPGTTVEVSRGKGKIEDKEFEIIDTPGMYSLLPITEDERVARSILLEEKPRVVVQLVDAKNLERMLPLTLQLIEARLPLILVLNMMDEAEKSGISVDADHLEEELGVPVVSTVAVTGRGIEKLERSILNYSHKSKLKTVHYHPNIESSLEQISNLLEKDYLLSNRTIALSLLQDDPEIWKLVKQKGEEKAGPVKEIVEKTQQECGYPPGYFINRKRKWESERIVAKTVTYRTEVKDTFREKLSRLMMRPLTGIPILLLVLYFGLYQFVGVFGAQTLVDFLEAIVFEEYFNPVITRLFSTYVPYTLMQELFVGEYGIITLGVRYAVAIILPIVGTFFIAFSIIEDTGYLPRMALLIDRIFKKIGLNGRAVIPMTLGFGCDTMAVIVTRTLETKRERTIATLLLALAIPCSAQLGVLLGILAGNPLAVIIWVVVLVLIFMLVGFLTAQLMPGERPSFFMEIPPLRRPKVGNVLMKTCARMEWYFKEVFPLFILASVLIWAGQITGVFDNIVNVLAYPVGWIGLPKESAVAFLFGFFRRDYGAAGLFDLQQSGALSGSSLVVAAVTLTLFVPCIAQFSVNARERGLKTALAMALFIFPFAFLVGFLLNLTLIALGVQL